MSTAVPAHKGRLQINGTNLYIQEMQVQCDSEWIDITTFEDWDATRVAMFRKRLAGIRDLKFRINGFYDMDEPPTAVGQDGATITNLKYWPNVRDYPNRYFNVPFGTLDNVTVGSKMPGANYCTYSSNGMSQGGYDFPAATG